MIPDPANHPAAMSSLPGAGRFRLGEPDLRAGAAFVGLYVGATALARLGLSPDGQQAFWYPAVGLALAAVMVRGVRMIWAVLAAILLNLLLVPPGLSAWLPTLITVAVIVLPVLVTTGIVFRRIPSASREVQLAAAGAVAVIAPAIQGLLESLGPASPSRPDALLRWASQAAPALAIVPLALIHGDRVNGWVDRRLRPPSDERSPGIVSWLGCAAAAALVSVLDAHPATDSIRTSYLPLVPIAWMSLRYGLKGATGAILIANVTYVAAVTLVAVHDNALTYLSLLIGINITGLLIGAIAEGKTSAERRSEEATRLAGLIADNSTDVILVFDQHGRIQYASPSGVGLFGYPAGASIGRHGLDFAHPEDAEDAAADFARILDGKQVHTRVVRARRADGTYLWVERTGRSFVDPRTPDERRVIMVLRDITERRVLEESLQQSQKLESVGRLAGGIAHDFNNLLTAILGHASLLVEDDRLPDDVKGQAQEMQRAAERAAGLTGQLLAFARRQTMNPRVLDLNELVGGVEKLLRRVLTEEVRLTTALEPDLWKVKADAGQLEQVLLNLGVNARDAMPDGGRIAIATANRPGDGGRFDPDTGTGAHVELAVADTGHGMDANTLAKIFEPFFTTKAVGKGTGLGLAVCDGIIRQAGGRIEAESTVGVGTTFRIRLPVSAAATEETPVAAPAASAPGNGETILLVEDDALVKDLVVRVLTAAGYQVITADTGDEALARSREMPVVDALITDVILPGLSGPRLADAIRDRFPGLKILFISGLADADQEARKAEWALGGFLQKPFTPEALRSRVRDLLDETLTPATGLARLPTALNAVLTRKPPLR